MRLDPRNLVFEQGNPFGQLILREAVKRLQRQLTGGIAARPGAILFVHTSGKIDLPALAVNTSKG